MAPPTLFAAISFVLIAVTAILSSLTQLSFFRQAIIDRESVVVSEMVTALVREQQAVHQLSAADLDRYAEATAQADLGRTFHALENLSGVVLVKVFDRTRTIIWSSKPQIIGKALTRHQEDLSRAIDGEVRAVFNAPGQALYFEEELPKSSLIEFYVPFRLDGPSPPDRVTSGVVALYRSPDELNRTVWHGLLLMWAVTWVGGLLLFVALYKLFLTVYHGRRKAESELATLSTEHERIIHIEKLSAMGQLVSEIAHQLNNPLVGVINLTELAEREVNNPQRVKELLAEVRQAGGHCRDFVQKMLLLNKVARYEPQPTDMVGLVRETIAFFQQSLGNEPAVTLQAPGAPVMLDVDPVLVRHALFNLIHNAAEAAPTGPVAVSLAPDTRDGVPGCRLTVTDSGPGLKPEVMAKLFTSFFTTRPGGTGLGLSVAQHIAVLHGGSIHAENRPEGGACFTIWLPVQRRIREGKGSAR
ncbi:MAG: HAMP domain-containing sensor histidine kinase [Burkholderiales bacterium]